MMKFLAKILPIVLGLSLVFVSSDGESQYKRVLKSKAGRTAAAQDFKIIAYGQVWAYQEFDASDVDWNGIDIHILFQETTIWGSPPYWSLIGNTADSAEYMNGRDDMCPNMGNSIRDSLHAHGAKHLVTLFTVNGASGMDSLAEDSVACEAFADAVVAWCQRHGVDGVDFDYEECAITVNRTAKRRMAQRIIYRNLNAAGLIFVIPGGLFEQKEWDPDFCDYNTPQYYGQSHPYNSCQSANAISVIHALQVSTPDPCASPNYLQGYGLRDSLRLSGWSEDYYDENGQIKPYYSGGPGSYVHYGWPKSKMGAGYGTYGILYLGLSDTTLWVTPSTDDWATSLRVQDIRAATLPSGVYQKYNTTRECWTIQGRPSTSFDIGWKTWPSGNLGFMTIPTNDNVTKWTEWLYNEGYGAIMLYGMYEDYQPDSANGSGRFSMLESVKRALGRIP